MEKERKKIESASAQSVSPSLPPTHIDKCSPRIRVLGTVGIGALPIPARLGYLPSAGTSLLDYKRGVPVARPHGGQETR
jgi:hypothetical protein